MAEAEGSKLLTTEQIATCLSKVGKTGDGTGLAYVNLDLRSLDLTDLAGLENFPQIRHLDIAENKLTNISKVTSLQYLLSIIARGNQLTDAMDFAPLQYLQVADLSKNKIKEIKVIKHPMLTSLNLNRNHIEQITGLDKLAKLRQLQLRGNKIIRTVGLKTLKSLEELYLAENELLVVEELDGLSALTILHLRHNSINNLDGFSDKLAALSSLNLRDNQISTLEEIKKLENLPSLKSLSLQGNPVCEIDDYRTEVLALLPKLHKLDKDVVTREEKTAAAELVAQRLAEAEEAAKAEEEA